MKTLSIPLSICLLSICLASNVWADNPCMPIAKACMGEGYYRGGNTVGKGLVENCVMPIVMHNKTIPNTDFSDAVLSACKSTIMQQMKKH